MSAPFSPIMMVGAFVLAPTNRGMIEASITRRRCRPWTRNCGSATGFPSTSLDRHQALDVGGETLSHCCPITRVVDRQKGRRGRREPAFQPPAA